MRKAVVLLALFSLVIFSISTVSFSQTLTASSSTYRGDINEDGQVNIFDLLEMLKMLGSMEGKTERQRQIADVNISGSVDIFDLLGLLKVISGTETPSIISFVQTLTGRIIKNGSGLSSVLLYITGESIDTTITTGIDGSYSFNGLFEATYTITPMLGLGYIFGPSSVVVTISGSDFNLEDINAITVADAIKTITMISIPAGIFQMGTNDTDNSWLQYSRPVHTVNLSSFLISETEITQAQYMAVMGTNPSYFDKGLNYPVDGICWYDAATFCNRLSELENLQPCYDLQKTWSCDFSKNGFRLATEAEWEYACRAGTYTKFYTGNDESDLVRAGWYKDNSGETTHPVGEKEPNAFGLYDMHGNVWEWCTDGFWLNYYNVSPNTNPVAPYLGDPLLVFVMRGGAWRQSAEWCLTALRWRDYGHTFYHNAYGFRVVRSE